MPVSALLNDLDSQAEFALVHSYGGYATNLPVEDLLDGERFGSAALDELALLVAMGAQLPGAVVQLIDGGIEHGILSMDSFVWGLPT